MYRGLYANVVGIIIFLSLPAIMFLLEAGLINFYLQFVKGKEGTWRDLGEVFLWKRLRRLFSVFLCVYFSLVFFILLQYLFGNLQSNLFVYVEKSTAWMMFLLIPIQFFAILSILENQDARFWNFFRGLREMLYQRWEMWMVWLLVLFLLRIFSKLAWVLAWWIPYRFLEIPYQDFGILKTKGLWILFLYVLLASCILPLGTFFLLSLRALGGRR